MEVKPSLPRGVSSRAAFPLSVLLAAVTLEFVLLLVCFGGTGAKSQDSELLFSQNPKVGEKDVQLTHSCIHDEILHQRHRPGRKEYSVTPQIYYQSSLSRSRHRGGRALLEVSSVPMLQKDAKQPIRILLNYDAVGHSPDRDCRNVGDLVKLGEPPVTSVPRTPVCKTHGDRPVTVQVMDEKLGRMVTRVVLPRVVMHARHHYGVAVDGVWKDHVQEIVASMAHAIQMVPVSVTVALLALIAPLLFAMSSAACMEEYATMDAFGQHCAPSEPSILQQLEAAVVMPNYNRLMPGGRMLFSILNNGHCAAAAKRLACWISIQRCDKDGDNRLRVCHSACRSYNAACGASLDCSDQTLFGSGEEGEGQCTGYGEMRPWWMRRISNLYSQNQQYLWALTGLWSEVLTRSIDS
ncbi:hypothetical protein C4D60_Mb03t16300 [Musa balbisiana]|uniref:FZ domain-containing protein n=1 Tax=Musa balbisiana TaxID=52838 RepID=A0A4S8JCR3_MUSBA|nr:hypothetical protein C4D60_Mb03t16300 [Musa balbisiana]